MLPWDTLVHRKLIPLALVALCACSGASQAGFLQTFDPCNQAVRADGASAAQLATASAALKLWNDAAGTDLALDADAPRWFPRVSLVFDDNAGPFRGFYDDAHATVYVNAMLDPAAQPIVLAHELGHTFGLVHVPPEERASLMNPANLDVTPTPDDVAALFALWPRCDARAPARARAH